MGRTEKDELRSEDPLIYVPVSMGTGGIFPAINGGKSSPSLLEARPEGGVGHEQRPGDAVSQCASLAHHSTTAGLGHDPKLALGLCPPERLGDKFLPRVPAEPLLHGLAVDDYVAALHIELYSCD